MLVEAVNVGPRHRKDLGDLKPLAESIDAEGLLQPIGLTPDKELVFGMRRFLAVRDILGWDRIDARTVNVSSIAAGEYAENELRKDFTLSERDAIRRTLEKKIGDRRIAPSGGVEVGNSPQVEPGEKTRDLTARQAGFRSTDEARAVRQVTGKGSPKLVEAMDQGTLPVSVAAKVAELPKAKQNEVAKAEDPRAEARRLLADSKTPHQQAEEDPGRRWSAGLHKLYVLLNSTRDLGGIAKLTRKWAAETKQGYIAELKRIVGELNKWIKILEKKP